MRGKGCVVARKGVWVRGQGSGGMPVASKRVALSRMKVPLRLWGVASKRVWADGFGDDAS